MKTLFKTVYPYQTDKMNLPVANVETAVPFYEKIMGFQVIEIKNSPYKCAILERDNIQIGLAENGVDPTQDGCFFEVNNVEAALAEFKANGLEKEAAGFEFQKYGNTSFKVFFVVAPDGLCYCFGERQT